MDDRGCRDPLAVIARWEDFAIILLLLMTNAVVGFLQERKAENAIELLKKQLAPNARVLRDGTWQEIWGVVDPCRCNRWWGCYGDLLNVQCCTNAYEKK